MMVIKSHKEAKDSGRTTRKPCPRKVDQSRSRQKAQEAFTSKLFFLIQPAFLSLSKSL